MAKNTHCFKCGNLYNHSGLEMLGGKIFFAEKIWFCQRSKV